MSVTLQPSEFLRFSRPLTRNVTCSLNITNPNANPVSFKVNTTAPKLYSVRPYVGKVDPGQTVGVQVTLQPMKEEPPLNAKCKDKFVIQSMLIPPEKAGISLRDLWTAAKDEETGKVHSQKVRVEYLEGLPLDNFFHRIILQPSTGNLFGFNRPLTRNVKRSLDITNPNVDPIFFQIKISAPKRYCVWPISGKVDPGQTVKVQVILLAMKKEPPLNAKCEDKLRIETMLIPPEKAAIPLHDLWINAKETGKVLSETAEVNYLPSEDQPLDVGDEVFHWHRITLQPSNSIGFNRPLTQDVKRSLNITNSNSDPISFKISTTAFKLYFVRPNIGKIDPGQTVEIQVTLLAMKEEPPPNAKCKDRFLIQIMSIPPEKAAIPFRDLWTTPWDGETGWVDSQRVRVEYLPPASDEYALIISVG